MKKIGVLGLADGWSTQKLVDAFEQLTGYRLLIDLARVAADLTEGKLWFEGVDLTALDGLVIKKVGPAYSPELLDRLELLRLAKRRGVRVFSDPEHIIRVMDRLSCTTTLALHDIPLPPTLVTEDPKAAAAAVDEFGPSVLKPLYTSKARGMVVVKPGPQLLEEIINFQAGGNRMIYIQKKVELPGKDLGLVFLGGRYLATYARVGQKGRWNTTTNSGGRYQSHQPDRELIELADRAQEPFGLDFTCVDVAETPNGPVVFEVSAFGGFRGLQEGCAIDAARAYAEYVLKELDR